MFLLKLLFKYLDQVLLVKKREVKTRDDVVFLAQDAQTYSGELLRVLRGVILNITQDVQAWLSLLGVAQCCSVLLSVSECCSGLLGMAQVSCLGCTGYSGESTSYRKA